MEGYKYLLTYKLSLIIFDLTWDFTPQYYFKNEDSRQRDQLKQAARSTKQNIVEGSSERSLSSKLKLYDVAKSSSRELLEDFEDILRQKGLAIWPKDDVRMRELRDLRVMKDPFPHLSQIPHIPQNPQLAANLMIMLCQRTTYLLTKQIESLKEKFINEGGFRENLFKQRLAKKTTQL